MEATLLRKHSLVEEVSDRLAGAIRGGQLALDGLLPSERTLAERFGVSRPVVREATKRLELQGLIEVRQGVGIRVVDRLHAPVSAAARMLLPEEGERLRQSLEVRLVLEPEIARRAAERAGKGDLATLRKIHAGLEDAPDLAVAMECDLAFHRELARISGNEIFGLMLDSIADLGRGSRRATMSAAGVGRAVKQHAAVLKAIEGGDAATAARAMRKHIETAVSDLSAHQVKPRS
jgi:GntR family transcriptional repressor for pyruvate dehydrogenase complex